MATFIGNFVFLMFDIGLYQIQTWFIIGLGLAFIKQNKE
jgi:hypothetical protein